MQETFLKLYDQKIDEIFLYSFKETEDRELAKWIVQKTFTKAWNYIKEGHTITETESKLFSFTVDIIAKERQFHHIHAPQFMPSFKMS